MYPYHGPLGHEVYYAHFTNAKTEVKDLAQSHTVIYGAKAFGVCVFNHSILLPKNDVLNPCWQ